MPNLVMDGLDPLKTWLGKVGLCIKNQRLEVLYQNEICQKLCSPQVGSVCDKWCIKYIPVDAAKASNRGFTKVDFLETEAGILDFVLLNDGDQVITIQFLANEKYRALLSGVKLTNAEQRVISEKLHGSSNREIARRLFISASTLKTHLNSIYRKIPGSLKAYLTKRKL